MLETNELNGAAFRLDIQGLRAIAVLAIIAYHAGLPLPGGFVGVDMFFVISGFVITAMLLREWNRHRKISFRNFYFRRVKRLAPALAFMTVVTVSVSFLVLSPFGPQELVAQTGIGAILSVANIVIARSTGNYFDPAADANPLLHTWSLSVEEQFYWIFPMLLSLGLILGSRLRTLFQKAMLLISLMLAVAVVMMVITNLPEFYNAFPWLSAFYDPLTRFWEFAVGVCLAIAAPKLRSISPKTSGSLAILGTLLVIVSFLLIDEELPFPGRWTLLPVLGTGFLIIAGFNKPNPFSRVLSSAPLVQVGNYSYSLYLWHWPFIVFAYLLSNGNEFAVLLAAVLSFVPAYFSYRYIENPIRELKHLGGPHYSVRVK
jgi:peptidoglycan/LPS O-acetylase OafA/YrhL